MKRNVVTVVGKLDSDFADGGDGMMVSKINVERLSGNVDTIPIMCKKNVCMGHKQGDMVQIVGAYRSYNADGHLILIIHADSIKECSRTVEENNFIYLRGNICIPATYRETPMGRTISDVILAVNKENGKADFIPCIFWGKTARKIRKHSVGDEVSLSGRIQSRKYTKDGETKTAYEISVAKLL